MRSVLQCVKDLFNWVLPPVCILCRQPADREEDLCQACFNELPILPDSCRRCANTFTSNSQICGPCQLNPQPYDQTFALFAYEAPITKLIMELKFHQRLVNARILGQLMAKTIPEWYGHEILPQLIIPMPLHNKRLQERGFNQAVEISRPIAKQLGIPIDNKHCLRMKNTQAQAQLSLNHRKQNIKKAFSVQKNYNYYHVAIVDDVITSGNTVREFATALKGAGARKVDVWCCAKTPLST